jgi:pyruvate,water dikinase
MGESKLIKKLSAISINDIAIVGGKNASLGELIQNLQPKGIPVPDGFATTADAFRLFLKENNLEPKLKALIQSIDGEFTNLNEVSKKAKRILLDANLPLLLKNEVTKYYQELCDKYNRILDVAVRSSATAEDLPTASFAGQHESFLNVNGIDDVLTAIHKCFASLYNARAIKYRIDNGFDHNKVYLSTGIQLMVRSDKASSGVCFTIEPDSGFQNTIIITGCWGLGENIVQGAITPDEFHVFKPTLGTAKNPIVSKKLGSKSKTMIYAKDGSGVINSTTSEDKKKAFTLTSNEIITIAKWAVLIEEHYKIPMDIEWAKDGISNKIFIVQARPETIHSLRNPYLFKEYNLLQKGTVIVSGNAVGTGISSGIAKIINATSESNKLNNGEVLVTDITNPDWDPIMKKAAAIITNKGGRTSHAAIVAREVGTIAIVGATGATEKIKDGDLITVDNSQGKYGSVYSGKLDWNEVEHDFKNIQMPKTKPMFILADPDKAYKFSFYPNEGVGLMRLEFVITNSIKIHPMALVKFDVLKDLDAKKEIEILTYQYPDKKDYFVDKLSQAIGTIAAAFYPKDVIVRMSDFKTNEYANLLGGKQFESEEENPMIGFRGASRYYNERYKEGFKLECEAMKVVRNDMGLNNVKLMIPFCRTVEEGQKVVDLMKSYGLIQGEKGLEIYVMAEIPSNVILAEEFAKVFDGFSIGSNDLTQLTLGIDRDSAIISSLFDENNAAVKYMIEKVIKSAKKCGVKIGLCGQAPSDDPTFASFLINNKIDSISFNPDALLNGIKNMKEAENKQQ